MIPEGTPIREAAERALGLPAGAPPEAVRAAVLQRLAADGFQPPPVIRQAVGVLIGQRAVDQGELSDEVERIVTDEIAQFADGYWSFDPPARQARFRQLRMRANDFPRLRLRLDDLSRGLDFTPPTGIADPLAKELMAIVLDLYPRTPADRSRQKMARLDAIGRADDVRAAATYLLTNVNGILVIDRGLLQWLAHGDVPAAPIQVRRQPSLPSVEPAEVHDPVRKTSYSLGLALSVILIIVICEGLVRNSNDRDRPVPDRKSLLESDRASRGENKVDVAGVIFEVELKRLAPRGTPPLTRAQFAILRRLAERKDLSADEADTFAAEFYRVRGRYIGVEVYESEVSASLLAQMGPSPAGTVGRWLGGLTGAQRDTIREIARGPAAEPKVIATLLKEWVRGGPPPVSPRAKP